MYRYETYLKTVLCISHKIELAHYLDKADTKKHYW